MVKKYKYPFGGAAPVAPVALLLGRIGSLLAAGPTVGVPVGGWPAGLAQTALQTAD